MAGKGGNPRIAELGRDFWEHGKGAAWIRWGTPNATTRCHRLVMQHAGMSSEHAWGYCAERHHAVLGTWPGQKAGKGKGKGRRDADGLAPAQRRGAVEIGGDVSDRAFDEALHPRAPAGGAAGGQFVSEKAGEGGGGAESDEKQQEVKAVQKLLGLPMTGKFGPADVAAVKEFQQKNGLQVDGVVGAQTISALLGEPGRVPGKLTAADRKKLRDIATGVSKANKEKAVKTAGKAVKTAQAAVKTAKAAKSMSDDSKTSRDRRGADATETREMPFDLEPSGDGLTLSGYAAVFDFATAIRDHQGEFLESIAPGAFAESLRSRMPVLMFEHGKHPLIGTMPLGVLERAEEDENGLYVEARLSDNWLVRPVRDAIRDGGVKGMSFRFTVPSSGDEWTREDGMDSRRILRANVSELGPVVFPAYAPTTASIRSALDHLPDLSGASVARSAERGREVTQVSDAELTKARARRGRQLLTRGIR